MVLPDVIKFNKIKANWDDLFLPIGFREHIEHKIIDPVLKNRDLDVYSCILFGPPGTGKTTIPHAIAKKLQWDLYEIGPHTFAKSSESVESAVRTCFDEIQKINQDIRNNDGENSKSKLVFVFDEIDEFVVTRDDDQDRQTRFSTTMMLPLLNELRKMAKEYGFIFFVLTNHIERFDPAIKRTGRFDQILPIGPPDRSQRYLFFEKTLTKLRNDYNSYNIDLRYLPIRFHQIPFYRLDLDLVSRASRRLGFGDIESICKKVIEQKLLSLPYSLEQLKKFKQKRVLVLNTKDFIEWINKYRNSSADIQEEIERFYQDYPVYSRDASPYLDMNNLQDRIHKEFSTLNFKHNIPALKSSTIDWPSNTEKTLFCSIRNLADLSTFIGKLNISVSGAGVNKKNYLDCFIVAGRPSGLLSTKIKPLKKGKLKITFIASGFFEVGGITVLSDRTSKVNGKIHQTHELLIS